MNLSEHNRFGRACPFQLVFGSGWLCINYLAAQIAVGQTVISNQSGGTNAKSFNKIPEDGIAPVFQDAPICCIYIGLNWTNWSSSWKNLQRLAERHQLHRPTKAPGIYSGPPLSDFVNEHVAFRFNPGQWTTNAVMASTNNTHSAPSLVRDPGFKAFLIGRDSYWISKSGPFPNQMQASPFKSRLLIFPHDPQYPIKDFKALCDSVIAELKQLYADQVLVIWDSDGS